jgi:hypothetical protein
VAQLPTKLNEALIRRPDSTKVAALIIALCFFAPPLSSQHRTYFVSPHGKRSHTGLSIDAPLASVNAAIRKATAGDTVYLLPGTYREIINVSHKKGIPEHPICLMGLSSNIDDYPLIDGGAVTPSSSASCDWMRITRSEWIEIARLKFRNGWTFPIKVSGSSYVTFRSCRFWGGKRVINAYGAGTHHILVEDCYWDQGGEYLWRLVEDAAGVPAWISMHHGTLAYFNGSLIDFSGTGGSVVIRGNTVINAFQAVRYRGQKGYDSNVEIYNNKVSNMRDNDFEPEYYTYNLHIYHNVSHNIHRTLSVDNVEGGEIYYYGNIVTADTDSWSLTVCSGVWKVYGRPHSLSSPIYAFNNSFYVPGIAFQHMPGKALNLKHWNNAYFFIKDGGWGLNQWDSSDDFDYDISNKPWAENLSAHGQEVHGILGDAGFVDPAHGNLILQAGSKGIDAGRAVAFKELDWTQPYTGNAPDIGAYEGADLVQGPPFRFAAVSPGKTPYKEKPRIVRYNVDGMRVTIYFSDRIDSSTVDPGDIELFAHDRKTEILAVTFPRNEYEMMVQARTILPPGQLSISFKRWPRGRNGEFATSWASAMTIHN